VVGFGLAVAIAVVVIALTRLQWELGVLGKPKSYAVERNTLEVLGT
jgi:hypothetical protein